MGHESIFQPRYSAGMEYALIDRAVVHEMHIDAASNSKDHKVIPPKSLKTRPRAVLLVF